MAEKFSLSTLREKESSRSNFSCKVKPVAVALTVFLVGTNIIIVNGIIQHLTVFCSSFRGQLKSHSYLQCNS